MKRARIPQFALAIILLGSCQMAIAADTAAARQHILDSYAAEVRRTNPSFHGFSAADGRGFFLATPGTGHPETPSCTGCHTQSPLNQGHTRAGKAIAPMAVSHTPDRFTDPVKVERWFTRNCNTVYGRPCTAREKGDFITFMSGL